jgi:hypothetical protein
MLRRQLLASSGAVAAAILVASLPAYSAPRPEIRTEKVAAGAIYKKRCAELLPSYQWMSDIARRDRVRREMQCILRCKRGTR